METRDLDVWEATQAEQRVSDMPWTPHFKTDQDVSLHLLRWRPRVHRSEGASMSSKNGQKRGEGIFQRHVLRVSVTNFERVPLVVTDR